MASVEEEEAERFFRLLFGDFVGEHWLTVWTLDARKKSETRRFRDIAEAARHVANVGMAANVYFGIGLMSDPPLQGRGAAEHVTFLPAVYLDIDVADGQVERKKTGLPTTKADALRIVHGLRIPPTLLVDSGHGFQAYWRIQGGIEMSTPEDRAEAVKLTRGWNETARLVAKDLGYSGFDSTFDLARVYRAPGSFNVKGEPRRCFLKEPSIGDSGPSYDRDFLYDSCAPDHLWLGGPAYRDRSVIEPVAPVLPDERAGVFPKLAVVIENDGQFAQVWNKARPLAGPSGDNSPSAWHMSLSSRLVGKGFTDQEVVNALWAWNAKHGLDGKKLQRRGYVMRTIGKAKTTMARSSAMDEVAAIADDLEANAMGAPPEDRPPPEVGSEDPESDATEGEETKGPVEVAPHETGGPTKPPEPKRARGSYPSGPPPLPNEDRDAILSKLSKALGIQIRRVIKHGRERGNYSFELSDGHEIGIGPIEIIFNSEKVRARVADATGVVFGDVKKPQWLRVVQVIARAAELVDNEESTRAQVIEGWVGAYLCNVVHRGEAWADALRLSEPFERTGRIYLHANSLRKFIRTDGDMIERADLLDMLRHVGFESCKISARVGGIPMSKAYWTRKLEAKHEDAGEAAASEEEETA